jgi:hypothetical protein
MVRGVLVSGLLVTAAVDAAVSNETDLIRYGVTQGGLLAVVLVLLWFNRREKTDLTTLVRDNTEAMTRMASSADAQKDATHRLARAVEKLEDR